MRRRHSCHVSSANSAGENVTLWLTGEDNNRNSRSERAKLGQNANAERDGEDPSCPPPRDTHLNLEKRCLSLSNISLMFRLPLLARNQSCSFWKFGSSVRAMVSAGAELRDDLLCSADEELLRRRRHPRAVSPTGANQSENRRCADPAHCCTVSVRSRLCYDFNQSQPYQNGTPMLGPKRRRTCGRSRTRFSGSTRSICSSFICARSFRTEFEFPD